MLGWRLEWGVIPELGLWQPLTPSSWPVGGKHQFTISICPSVWYAVPVWPHALNSSVQNLLIKIRPRLETIECGTPCSRTISRIKTSATIRTVNECFRSINCPYLFNRSMTTKIVSQPPELGSRSMKSWKHHTKSSLESTMAARVHLATMLYIYFVDTLCS